MEQLQLDRSSLAFGSAMVRCQANLVARQAPPHRKIGTFCLLRFLASYAAKTIARGLVGLVQADINQSADEFEEQLREQRAEMEVREALPTSRCLGASPSAHRSH